MSDVNWISVEKAVQLFFVTEEKLSELVNEGEIDKKYIRKNGYEYIRLMEHQIAKRFERRVTESKVSSELSNLARGAVAGVAAAATYDIIKDALAADPSEQTTQKDLQKFKNAQVIFADDDEVFISEIRWQWTRQSSGFEGSLKNSNIIFAHNTHDAFKSISSTASIIHRKAPMIAFLDLWFPTRSDGIDLIKKIRFTADLSNVFIVVLTASNSQSDANECYRAGANLFINKGYGPNETVWEMLSLIDNSGGLILPASDIG